MSKSKYSYVKKFELSDSLLPNTYIVLRIDGHHFHRFAEAHQFEKPNDVRALMLMDHAARAVMDECPDNTCVCFLFRKSTTLYNRRASKLLSIFVSHFTSAFVMNWHTYFPTQFPEYIPTFDGRIVLYPSEKEIRDYFSWRQIDTHINNLYNTIFWALVLQDNKTAADTHTLLKGTLSSTKQEMLFTRFGINYNDIHPRFRKGSVLTRVQLSSNESPFDLTDKDVERNPQMDSEYTKESSTIGCSDATDSAALQENSEALARVAKVSATETLHIDIISEEFWKLQKI